MALQQSGHRAFSTLAIVDDTDVAGMIARLDAIIAQATPQQVIDGKNWYAEMHATLQHDSALTGIPVFILAHVFSALSANTNIAANVRAYRTMLEAFNASKPMPRTATLYGASDEKAWRILFLQDAALIGNGEKTRAFAMNLQELEQFEGGEPAVTVDTVMYQAATGRLLGKTIKIADNRYKRLRMAIQTVAQRYNLRGYECQAILWVAFRNAAW